MSGTDTGALDAPYLPEPDGSGLWWVAVFLEDRCYGGPEKGSWYFDRGVLVSDPYIYETLQVGPAAFVAGAEARAFGQNGPGGPSAFVERGEPLRHLLRISFMLNCCCSDLNESVAREMADDPEWAKSLLRRIGVEELAGHRLRRLADDGCCGMLLDWQLQLRRSASGSREPSSDVITRIAHRRSRPGSSPRSGMAAAR